jgi:endophilin-A
MSFKTGWEKFKQGTRETFGSGDKTQLAPDLVNMVQTAETVKRSYEAIISKTETYLTGSGKFDVFSGSKDKLTRVPIYMLATTFKEAAVDFDACDVGKMYQQCSDTLVELAQHELNFDIEVRNRFLQPKINFVKTDLKEAFYHYDKLKSRRLDYDAKRHKMRDAKPEKITKYEMDLQLAQRKLDESTDLSRQYFVYIADQKERSAAQCAELMSLMHFMMEYHRQCYEVLRKLDTQMEFGEHMSYVAPPKPQVVYDKQLYPSPGMDAAESTSQSAASLPRYQRLPQCRVLYDFLPQQEGDLELHVGDIVEIIQQEQSNWWEGMLDGRTGTFPSNYVELL